MSNPKRQPKKGKEPPRRDPLASLRMADIMISKPVLPAELIEKIVDFLDIPDLLRFARVSRRSCEMVYDDARWIKKLRRMGCWNEAEARKIVEAHGMLDGPARVERTIVNGKGRPVIQITNQSPVSPSHKQQGKLISPLKTPKNTGDGFSTVDFATGLPQQTSAHGSKDSTLSIFKSVRSVRGQARMEYAKIYRVLAPLYRDALADVSTKSLIFRTYDQPEQQATMLAQVNIFAKSDSTPGEELREEKLSHLKDIFNTAALWEFSQGYEYKEIQGRMKQYAHVTHILDGGQACVDLYLRENRLFSQKASLGTVGDCIDYSLGRGELSLERVQAYFERLGSAYAQEAAIIQTVFPEPDGVLLRFLERVSEEILSPFLASLFQDAMTRGASTYLRVISGTFAATKTFVRTYTLPAKHSDEAVKRTNEIMIKMYEAHVEQYLAEEYAFFKQRADREVEQWDTALSEQDASAETFLMSNVNRQAEKKDFMSTFKKVVMAPVNILPKMGSSKTKAPGNAETLTARPESPAPLTSRRSITPTLPIEAPTTELAAKAALMTNKLESIKSLFSVEVALNLVHAAKSSLERAAQFISLEGEVGGKAKKECAKIFVTLVDEVGNRHVKTGFDKAISHLSAYNPREAHPNVDEKTSNQPIVAPLTTFLELVNVGDLIQQMLDVFFESELIAYGIAQRDDFQDAPVKEKRKFEAMLDESVAAGLSKGIDVLMDEVEYICATEQSPNDYNPALFDATTASTTTFPPSSSSTPATNSRMSLGPVPILDIDISPTATALKIIRLIALHHKMLVGTTDKTLLDVFTTELGLRIFQTLTKHIKRQRISPPGAIRLLTDLTEYSSFIANTFRNQELNTYFTSLREVGQIFLIEGKTDKEIDEMSGIIADQGRYGGVFGVEEVVEFVERRSDWIAIRAKVEGKIRGEGCCVM